MNETDWDLLMANLRSLRRHEDERDDCDHDEIEPGDLHTHVTSPCTEMRKSAIRAAAQELLGDDEI